MVSTMKAQNRGANGNQGSKWCRPSTRLALYLRAGFRCAWCGSDLTGAKPAQVTLDHLIPREDGGSHDPGNLVMACLSCNSARGARDVRESALYFACTARGVAYDARYIYAPAAVCLTIAGEVKATVARINAQRRAPLNRALARSIIRGDHPDPRGARPARKGAKRSAPIHG
jgi:hypothetical protein